MTPTETALEDCRKIARAIRTLGHKSSVKEIADATGLEPVLVMRRLHGSSTSAPLTVRRYFACDRDSGNWNLTNSGVSLSEPVNEKPV